MLNKKVLYALFGFLLLLLWLPLLQQQLKVVDSGKLAGVVASDTVNTDLRMGSWFDGTWQQSVNNHIQDNIGFRPDLIRLANQVTYSLFTKTNASVVTGKRGNLFEPGYITAYLGDDFVGEKKIRERVLKLKYIQDTLDRLGKKLVLLYAPNKARSMPEDIPDYFKKEGKKEYPTNYKTYLRLGDSVGLRQIDFNGWFVSLVKTAKYPVLARSSIHWTAYGALLAADSFQRFMKMRCGQHVPDISWTSHRSDLKNALGRPEYSEDDLGKLLNIMMPSSKEKFYHPELIFRPEHMEGKPTAIYISDSFMWMWTDLHIAQRLNASFKFWPYYHDLWTPARTEMGKISDINPMQEMIKADWIVIMNTEGFLIDPGGKFPDEAYDYFTGKSRK